MPAPLNASPAIKGTIMSIDSNVVLSRVASREFLIFCLGGEEYCIDILKVQEIRSCDAVTTIANTPAFIKGVINLRGHIVPIVDLRLKFRLAPSQQGGSSIVIILHLAGRMIGIVVDSVSDVIALTPEQIKPAPRFGAGLDTQFILGLGTLGERLLILVDIERLMSDRDVALIDAVETEYPDSGGGSLVQNIHAQTSTRPLAGIL
jgi:purine-binding chemotaxis protein CheW